MINRIADKFSSISDECFEQLAKVLENKDNKKLFSVVNSAEKANEIKKQLIANGYNVSIEKELNHFKVMYSSEAPKIKVTASTMSCFTPVGDNLYKSFQKVAGVYDYDFDDGSIWRIEKFDDGEYLVKEINSDDENDVVRTKTASLEQTFDDKVFKRIMKMFYGDQTDEIIEDALKHKNLKHEFEKILNDKLDDAIQSSLVKNKFIVSEAHVRNLHTEALKNESIVSKIDLNKFVRTESNKNTLVKGAQ